MSPALLFPPILSLSKDRFSFGDCVACKRDAVTGYKHLNPRHSRVGGNPSPNLAFIDGSGDRFPPTRE